MEEKVYKKIIQKKEFSDLPKEDVELVYSFFDKNIYLEEEKIKLTRDMLRKMYTAFVSGKLLNIKNKDSEWFLRKHISTKERLSYYRELYERVLGGEKKVTVFDLGAGINGFSYEYFLNLGYDVKYIGVEAVGQLVDLQNNYFDKNNLKSAKCIQESLFNLEKIKKIISKEKGKKIVFLFKTLDSLEMVKRNYSKELLEEIANLVDKVVVSFATRSLVSKKSFGAKRTWLVNFIEKNFKIIDNFELGVEKYIIFQKDK